MTSLLLILAAAALWAGGYLVAARRGRQVRAELADSARRLRTHVTELEASLARGEAAAQASALFHSTVANALEPLSRHERGVRALESDLRAELKHLLAPVLEKERDTGELKSSIRELLAPLSERERVAQQLATLVVPRGGRAALPQLLTAIAARVGLECMLLSDADGLLLAAIGDTGDGVALAGVSTLLVTFAERTAAAGAPAPIGVVVHDEANRMLLHRLFRVGSERYVLTAISRGRVIAPSALDPALGKIEELLAAEPLAAAGE